MKALEERMKNIALIRKIDRNLLENPPSLRSIAIQDFVQKIGVNETLDLIEGVIGVGLYTPQWVLIQTYCEKQITEKH